MDHVGTINGHLEAYYAVLSSNFIAGTIDANLTPIGNSPLVGALDMGGSSTQLIFYTGNDEDRVITPENFWSHSYLNFGVDRVRERVNSYLISEQEPQHFENDIRFIENPCTFKGYEQEVETGIVLRGTGDSMRCLDIIKEIVWPQSDCEYGITDPNDKKPCFIDGIEHPPIKGHFFGMSVYFFAIDCIRELGTIKLDSW